MLFHNYQSLAVVLVYHNLIYDAKLYVRIFEDLNVEDKKILLKALDEYYKEVDALKDSRLFNIILCYFIITSSWLWYWCTII